MLLLLLYGLFVGRRGTTDTLFVRLAVSSALHPVLSDGVMIQVLAPSLRSG
jgi:hypothetical protein